VVKPVSGGSSIDCFLRPAGPDGQADVAGPIEYLLARYGRCMVEQLVEGLELTVGVLFGRALPTIWIDPTGTGAGWFDYAAKYNTGDDAAAHRFDLPPSLDVGAIEGLCLAAHEAVGCRHLSRVDLIVGASGQVSLLEINTMPGFTGRSLVPDAARRAGIGFVELCDGLVRRAFADAGEVEHEVAA
jgi:D-alanine-D-alanine ligase